VESKRKEQADAVSDGEDITVTDRSTRRPPGEAKQSEPIYEPLPPPPRPRSFMVATDYMSLWNDVGIGRASMLDLRAAIYDHELSAFWDGVASNEYALQSVERPFSGSAGVRNEKINAFAVHDTELFAFNGTKDGHFAITNFSNHPFESIAVKIHRDRITEIRTAAQRPLFVYTAGYDGTLKILNLTRIPSFQALRNGAHHLFGDAVVDNDSVKIHGFDLRNAGREMLAVDDSGKLLLCDLRTHSNYEYRIAESKVAAIRTHPVDDHYFVIAENRRKSLQLRDFRKIGQDSKEAVHFRAFPRVQKAINFSSDGTALLSAGCDDFVRVFHAAMHSFDRAEVRMPHSNNTGIWICDFKPVFHPKYSEIVVTGSLQQKGIDCLFLGKDGRRKSHNVRDLANVKGVHSFGAFHPKSDEYLFGVSYEKMVFYARVPGADAV